ncbi:MAG: NAD(P)H-binding protein [Silanimonas sp.]
MQARLPLPEIDAQTRRVLLTGASGLVGGAVLKQLLAPGEPFEVVAPTRSPLAVQSARLRNVVYDSSTAERRTDSGLRRSLAGLQADIWICALGTTMGKAGNQAAFVAVDRDLVLKFAALSRALGARHAILVSSVGANAKSGNFYLRVKAEAERGLAEQNFPRVDILRPGLLLGERGERRPGEHLAQRLAPLYNPLLLGPLARFRAVEAVTVATAAVNLARGGGSGWFVHEYAGIREAAKRG